MKTTLSNAFDFLFDYLCDSPLIAWLKGHRCETCAVWDKMGVFCTSTMYDIRSFTKNHKHCLKPTCSNKPTSYQTECMMWHLISQPKEKEYVSYPLISFCDSVSLIFWALSAYKAPKRTQMWLRVFLCVFLTFCVVSLGIQLRSAEGNPLCAASNFSLMNIICSWNGHVLFIIFPSSIVMLLIHII